jgi:hypothetical protein
VPRFCQLLRGENTVQEALSMALHGRLKTIDLDDIYTS